MAKITFAPPTGQLHAQLADATDALGRQQAVELLAKRKDKTTVEKLTHEVLRNDSFYGVRIAASRALRGIATDAAYEALAGSTDQPNAKVRSQVVSDIASQPKPGALPHLKRILDSEKNPAIRAQIVSRLAGHEDRQANRLINQALGQASFRNQIADAAISALRKQDKPGNIVKIRAALEETRPSSPPAATPTPSAPSRSSVATRKTKRSYVSSLPATFTIPSVVWPGRHRVAWPTGRSPGHRRPRKIHRQRRGRPTYRAADRQSKKSAPPANRPTTTKPTQGSRRAEAIQQQVVQGIDGLKKTLRRRPENQPTGGKNNIRANPSPPYYSGSL